MEKTDILNVDMEFVKTMGKKEKKRVKLYPGKDWERNPESAGTCDYVYKMTELSEISKCG